MFRTQFHIVFGLLTASLMLAQAPNQQQQRAMGVVTGKQGSGANLRTDSGDVVAIVFSPETKFQRIAPGETNLKNAETISFSDLADGDRVLARGIGTDPKTIVAQSIVVISKTALAEKEQKERSDWQKRGISGTVTAVDAAKKEMTIRLPALMNAQSVTLAVKENAPLRRYAPDSVRFADTKPASFSDIKAGDQLRARGEKSADGARFTAEEVVTGSFQTIAANVISVDTEAKQVQVKDVDSGKLLTVRLTADSTLKRLPEFGGMGGGRMGGPGGPGGPGGQGAPGGPAAGDGTPARPRGPGAGGPGAGGPGGAGMGPGGPGGRMPDIQQMLERLPQSSLSELKPGETIIVASTKGAADHVTAITMVSNADRLIAMRRAMMAREGTGSASGNAAGPGGNWNLGEMSIPMP